MNSASQLKENQKNRGQMIGGDIRKTELFNQKNIQNNQKKLGWFQVYRFADNIDFLLMVIGILAATAAAIGNPVVQFFLGNIVNAFQSEGNYLSEENIKEGKKILLQFLYLAFGMLASQFLMSTCWKVTAARQSQKCRRQYFKKILNQKIQWFDKNTQNEISIRFMTDSTTFEKAIGLGRAHLYYLVVTTIARFGLALYQGWQLTAILLCSLPLLGLTGFFFATISRIIEKQEQDFLREADSKCQEGIREIKTVKSLNGEEYQIGKYIRYISKSSKNMLLYNFLSGLCIGLIFLTSLGVLSLGFWQGERIIERQIQSYGSSNYSGGKILYITISIVVGAFNLAIFAPSINQVVLGNQAALSIFSVIDTLDPNQQSKHLQILQDLEIISFQNVSFAYPNSKHRLILDKVNFTLPRHRIGLIGESGSGKSTIYQLLMRFYEPDEGRITWNGRNIKQIDIKWLRKQIGLVGQQPILFSLSIRQNLLLGNQKATNQEMKKALDLCQTGTFIMELQKKIDTFVGQTGCQLSGGQKQRIAIARALLQNRQLLLLDEVTSALDKENEEIIKNNLQKVCLNKMSLMISHNSELIKECQSFCQVINKKVKIYSNYKETKNYQQNKNQQVFMENQLSIIKKHSKKLKKRNSLAIQDEIDQNQQKQPTNKLEYQGPIYSRLFHHLKGSKFLVIFGILLVMANSAIIPLAGMYCGQQISLLLSFSSDRAKISTQTNRLSLSLLLLGVWAVIGKGIEKMLLNFLGDKITEDIKIQTYLKILKMPIPWFEKPENNVANLVTLFSLDCKRVRSFVSTYFGIIGSALCSFLASFLIGISWEWRICLATLGLMCVITLVVLCKIIASGKETNSLDSSYKQAFVIPFESITNIRTVKSLGCEQKMVEQYLNRIEVSHQQSIKYKILTSFFIGLTHFAKVIIFGLIFFVGELIIFQKKEPINVAIIAIVTLSFTIIMASDSLVSVPNSAECRKSASNLFQILDEQDEDQIQIKQHSKLLKTSINGNIVFQNVKFKYPSKKEYLFQDLNIEISKGKKISLIGQSGCGKSTLLQLLMRFYEIQSGSIIINNINIKDYDIHHLRQGFAVVCQQPTLFNTSIKQNIKYNQQNATNAEIYEAITKAQVSKFINTQSMTESNILKDNLEELNRIDQNTGIKGSHLSGGQKQRVAIARAILRKPEILLLDEATSALDAQNERQVQNSLDIIMQNKTTLIVAHHIITIQNSDEILFFQNGKIVQKGTFQSLLNSKKQFWQFYSKRKEDKKNI